MYTLLHQMLNISSSLVFAWGILARVQSKASAVAELASRVLGWSFAASAMIGSMVVIVADAWIVRLTIAKIISTLPDSVSCWFLLQNRRPSNHHLFESGTKFSLQSRNENIGRITKRPKYTYPASSNISSGSINPSLEVLHDEPQLRLVV